MRNPLFKLMLNIYRWLFVRTWFYEFHKFLYLLSLRGIGVLNYESDRLSGEGHFIEHHVSRIRDGVVFDVGANVGRYSARIRDKQQGVDIFAFEPHPTTYGLLVKNVDGMGIVTYNVGVGAVEGVLPLHDYADEDGSSHASLYKDVIERIHKGRVSVRQVRIISLDAFVRENSIERVGLLKIDTEGHELEVLKGFEQFIKDNRVDWIHFEFNEMNVVSKVFFKEFWDFLPNYDFFRMLPNGLVPIKYYSSLLCEIYAFQNIVAQLKAEFRRKDVAA